MNKNLFIKSTLILTISGIITKILGFIIRVITTRIVGTEVISLYSIVIPTYSLLITKLFGFLWGILFGGIPWLFLVLPALKQEPFYLIGYILGLASVLGMSICLEHLSKRTPYGNEMLGKIRGFKNYLKTAEKDKLNAMVMQDPTYFYNILPYTYVLGISDVWISKFETISMQAPTWYNEGADFDMVTFGTFMNSTMVSVQNTMSYDSTSNNSSGGGSSGGGSSGGGSGGGGGSSW